MNKFALNEYAKRQNHNTENILEPLTALDQNSKLKFYEISAPYYTILKAKNKEEAKRKYEKLILDEKDEAKLENIKEIKRDYALLTFGKSGITDVEKTLEIFDDPKLSILVVDYN